MTDDMNKLAKHHIMLAVKLYYAYIVGTYQVASKLYIVL